MKTWKLLTLTTAVASLFIAGCGGGSSSGGGAVTTPLTLFATDNLGAHDHVWVTLYKIELVDSSGALVTVFDSTSGETIDLRSLRDGSGARYQLLSKLAIPAGTYSAAKVTLAQNCILYNAGASSGSTKPFESNPGDPAGKRVVTLTFSTPRVLDSSATDLVLDFDLSQWEDNVGGVRPVVVVGNGNGLGDINRHEFEDYHGVVAGLTGSSPTQSFTMTLRGGGSVTVTTSASTVVFREDATLSPSIANGNRVEVQGKFDPVTRSIAATSVKIEDTSGQDRPEAYGTIRAFNSTAGSFTMLITRANLFVPDRKEVTVQTNTSTLFRAGRGVMITSGEFFSGLAGLTNPGVEVEGSYNADTGVVTATKVKRHHDSNDDGNGSGEAEAKGVPSNINGTAFTFTVTPSEWEGFSWGPSRALSVNGASAEEYEDQMGESINRATFFQALATIDRVKVYGRFDGTTFVADRLKLISNR